MAISFTGLGSGMDYSSWIDALVGVKEAALTTTQNKITNVKNAQNTLNTLKTSFTSLNSCLSTFTDSNIVSAFDIFSRKKVTTDDDGKTATATVTNSASVQNFELAVQQLATPTIATGINPLGKIATADTKLKDLNNKVIEEGEVSIYINDNKEIFKVEDDTTLGDFINFLEEKTGGTINFSNEGKLELDLAGSGVTDIKLGSTSDDGNLLDFFGFKTVKDENGDITSFSSSKILTTIDTSEAMVGSDNFSSGITEGTFKIGTVEFTIDSTTSMSGLIYQINSNADTGVTASYDAVANKMVLKAKEPGSTTINIEAGTSNFTDVVGLTNGSTGLASGSQVLGMNSKFTINGEEFEAASNTIGEDVTGITGLTLTLNKVSKDDDTVGINITNDLSEVEKNIEDFIKKYNSLVEKMKSATDSEGDLAYDSSLRGMITEMANTIMNTVPELNNFNCFSAIGISTGKTTTDVSNVSTALTFDKAKFEEAMAKNPEEVKKLFINENSDDASLNGVMAKLEAMVEEYLDIETGYFTTQADSYETQINTLNKSLTRKQTAIEEYRERLEKQFQSMDTYISKMQSYSSYLAGI